MNLRALSLRSPYRRAGLTFDNAILAAQDGRAMVEIDQATLRRLGGDGLKELQLDPSIELQVPPEIGRHGDVSLHPSSAREETRAARQSPRVSGKSPPSTASKARLKAKGAGK
jgi:hypothetical protein